MRNGKLGIYLQIVTIILFIFVPINLNFTIYPLGIFYIINFLIFILFWIIPIYLCYKNEKSSKYYVLIFIIFIVVSLVSGYKGEEYGKKQYRTLLSEARDSTRLSDKKVIIDSLDVNKNFSIIADKNLSDPKTCYYLKSNDLGYVIGMKFESKKFINKFGEIFIYNSNDNYLINDNEINNIKRIVSNSCEN